MLQIETKHLNIVQKILSKYPYQFYAYGSRVKGTAHKYSDLDLCYYENIDPKVIFSIKEELENSYLPFIVELVKWKDMRKSFQSGIKKDLVKFC